MADVGDKDMPLLDALVIGIGCPNSTSDGRVVQCCIAVTKELGLIRFFADYKGLMSEASIWDECRIEIQRTGKDSRDESFKLKSIEKIGKVTCPLQKRHILDGIVLESGCRDPIDYQNDRHCSIAVVKPVLGSMGFSIENRPQDEPSDWFVTSKDLLHRAHIKWTSPQGKQHYAHICAHEVMEGLRKNPSSPWVIFDYMRANDQDYDKWLVLGNMVRHRSTWIIVHVHRLKKTSQSSIATSSWIDGGENEGWPYLQREVRRARRVAFEPQGYLFTMSDTGMG